MVQKKAKIYNKIEDGHVLYKFLLWFLVFSL